MRDLNTHIDTSDEGPEFLGFADLLNIPFMPLSVGPFNSLQPTYIGEDLSTVPPLAGIKQPGSPIQPVQNIEADLMALRAEMPFLPILKPPQAARTALLQVANLAVNLEVPTSAVLCMFRGNGDYYVSFAGAAVRPIAGAVDAETATLYKPEGVFMYCGGTTQISVVSPSVNIIVQAWYWQRPNAYRS